MLGDVAQGFLHQPEGGEIGRRRHRHRREPRRHAHLQPVGELAAQDLQRRQQAQVVQAGRTQVFDDAALQRNAAVERLHQVLDPRQQCRCRLLQPRPQAGHVQLGGGEQRTQFVVQVTCQAGTLVLTRGLQVAGEAGELGGAVPHLHLQPVTFIADGLLLRLALALGLLTLAQHQRHQQQADQRDGQDAQPVALQGGEHQFQPGGHTGVLTGQHAVGHGADAHHLVTADAGEHQLLRGGAAAQLEHAQHLVHLTELGAGMGRQGAQIVGVGHGVGIVAALGLQRGQPLQALLDIGTRVLVGRQVFGPGGQQVATLAGLGVGHAAHQPGQFQPRLAHQHQVTQLAGGAPVAQLADAHQHQRQQHGQHQRPATQAPGVCGGSRVGHQGAPTLARRCNHLQAALDPCRDRR